MKNILGNILPIAGIVFILAGIVGLINKLFGTHIGIGTGGSSTEVPSDPVIVAVLIGIGLFFLGLMMLGRLRTAR